ncbi:MAG: hypothetical protein UW37_C0022G0003 [Candidatus Gottesmanbacteria bacterium GW2011_GWA2_44_17]|uniref:Uncharacterized protein n=1 Tax=Candidatus Gottesmanbacteria bacterium GW2011_GWA2_44_17 TaxID=1618444 RepID=A0A0G1HGT4_9BACT|nr:MAG: hypothetical protein UV63_C0027G0007 [Microgenomates group bacterium GW2011_GWC1_43_11]KKT46521.1 MAG: hypothetical protein UW37_C0022G0003 [Candidatus Gottesmanbacteria bacterium GW2011_GWA2_44_17]
MTNKRYDLKPRIFSFILNIVDFIKKIPDNRINRIFIDQLI